MIDFVLGYMEENGQFASTQKEQEAIEQGISLYLIECGVPESANSEYYRKYVKDHLGVISQEDLKEKRFGLLKQLWALKVIMILVMLLSQMKPRDGLCNH